MTQPSIIPGQDAEGMRMAFEDIFEEAFQEGSSPGISGRAFEQAASGNPHQLVEALLSWPETRRLAVGYYVWADYILWLEGTLDVGERLPLKDDEARGLRILKDVREQFSREHPACPQCGEPNQAFAMFCRQCRADFRKKVN